MTLRRTRCLVIGATALLVGTLLASPGVSAGAPAPGVAGQDSAATADGVAARDRGPTAPYELRNGRTAPVFSYRDAIRESAWVLAPDLDRNGERDRVAVDIVRPRELDGEARVPVVIDPSPYYACCGRGNESELKEYDADGDPTKLPLFYDNYFVPRGYAYIAVDMAGTNRSTGCVDMGARSDIESVRAVVDWLNGRARAVDADGDRVRASWTDGKVGMIGKSYDGTLANGVAATGVEGLETIVPIAAISSWYDYTRYQGLPFSYNYPTFLSSYVETQRTEPVDCSQTNARLAATDGDRTGAYTPFWSRRDYRAAPTPKASRVRASVFVVHGLQDTNVKTPNFARWWADLGRHDVQRKMWLSRVGHVDPFDFDRRRWVGTLHRWFDRELLGIRNGIHRTPDVRVERSPGDWVHSDRWPVAPRPTRLRPQVDGDLETGRRDRGTAAFVNDPTQREDEAVVAGQNPNRLLFTTPALRRPTRIAGTPRLRLQVRHGAPTGQVGVALVDYGPAERVLADDDGARTLETQSCWGKATAADDACYFDVVQRRGQTPLQVFARGWARLDGAGSHRVDIDLTANDVVVPAGHRLGLVVVGASPGWVVTVDPAPTRYEVALRKTSLRLPVRGGPPRFVDGRSLRSATTALPTADDLVPGTIATPPGPRRLPY